MSDSAYLFDNAAAEAGQRFDALAALFNPTTFRHLEQLGVDRGWLCWEVGAGGPTVSNWLASRVGPTGRVLATDINTSWVSRELDPDVEVRLHDVVQDAAPSHCSRGWNDRRGHAAADLGVGPTRLMPVRCHLLPSAG